MPEKCTYCGKIFENTKALGSHVHYFHEKETWASAAQSRSGSEKERFEKLLDGCLADRNLRKPRQLEKLEEVMNEIPEGISPTIDKYRQAYRCAITREELVKKFEEEVQREEESKQKK